MQIFIPIAVSILLVVFVTFAYIWARAKNKAAGGKAWKEKGDCHGSCCDIDYEKIKKEGN